MIFCGIGGLLVVTSIVVRYLIVPSLPVDAVWSRDDAEARNVASNDYHNKTFDKSASEETRKASAERYYAIDARLQAAKSRRQNLPRRLQIAGGSLIIFGAGCYYYQKAKSGD